MWPIKTLFFGCIFLGIALFAWTQFFRGGEVTVSIGSKSWVVEIASTPENRSLGLGKREYLPVNHGMLFTFRDIDPGRYSFWMKDMRFPLDIIWIREGRVVHVERNIPPDSPGTFQPSVEADSVLEVNGGEAEDIVPGDDVRLHGKYRK